MAVRREQRAREPAEVVGGREQPGVAGDPAERPGVAVVHLAPDETGLEALVAVELGRGDLGAGSRVSGRKRVRSIPKRRGDHLGEEPGPAGVRRSAATAQPSSM